MIDFGKVVKSSFIQQVSVLFLGTGVAQLITIASMPVLTRLYTPAEFGIYSVFFAISSIFAVIVTLRYELSIIPAKTDEEASQLFQLCITLTVFIGTLLLLTSFLLPQSFLGYIGISERNGWFHVSLIMGCAYAVIATCSFWHNRQEAYNINAGARVCLSFTAAFIGLSLGYFGFSEGLLWGQLVASVLVAVALVCSINVMWGRHENIKSAAITHAAAPKYLLPTALLDTICLQIPVLAINSFFSLETAGQFGLAWKTLMFPVAFLGGAVGAVFFRKFSAALPDKDVARVLLYKTWLLLAVIGVLPTLILMGYGEVIFSLFFGEKWSDAGKMVSVLAPMMLAVFIGSPTSVSYVSLGMQKFSLYFAVFSLLHRIASLGVGIYFDDFYLMLWLLVLCELVEKLLYQLLALKALR